MPGITCIISKQTTGKESDQLDHMLNCMLHEPIYNFGTYKNNKHGFYVGFVTIEDTFADCMPIYNEKQDIILFFWGECFGDNSIINNLRQQGHEFNHGNSSYLVHLYEEVGETFVNNLNGNYIGIVLDLRQSKAMIFNDRYGIQRIHYHENKDAFFFATEMKSLLKILPYLRKTDFESIGEFLTFDCVLRFRTYFSNIFLLPVGSAWIFKHGIVEKKQYFEPSTYENQPVISDENQFFQEVKETFKEIIPRYFQDENIGMSLTGGHDTRLIMACRDPEPGSLPSYTYSGRFRETFDVRIARKVAMACNQTHTTISYDENHLADFPAVAERGTYMTDGLSNLFFTDLVHFNKRAREISPIRMTGSFGGQVLRLGSLFWNRPPSEKLINHDFTKYMTTAQENFSEETKLNKSNTLSFMLFKEIPWLWGWGGSINVLHQVPRYPYLDNDFIKVLYRAPAKIPKGLDFQLRLIADFSPKLCAIVTNHGYCGDYPPIISKAVRNYYYFLNKLDKAFVRDVLPYNLHHPLMRINNLFHFEKLVLGRFTYRNYAYWFKKELSDYLRDMLLDNRTLKRPYWNKDYVKKIVDEHTKGRGNYILEIRKILTLELIHRTLIEAI